MMRTMLHSGPKHSNRTFTKDAASAVFSFFSNKLATGINASANELRYGVPTGDSND